ncbi:MAG: DUF465 domain-containing protein [Deltaproteobacteria bacterium]|nr:DUF465 domain-containing protein [Deltaproteobacteria bacterium]MDE0213998.1 DUF465 domain-containing protein [Deltaproteobacteria bacterium]
MEEREEQMIASVMDKDPELRKYYEEHLEYERLLGDLHDKGYLSPEEEMEKKRIQKLKLVGKDRIMQILGKYKSAS